MKSPILMWVAVGIGIILLYAAYKGKSAKSVVTDLADSVKK